MLPQVQNPSCRKVMCILFFYMNANVGQLVIIGGEKNEALELLFLKIMFRIWTEKKKYMS